MPSNLARVKAAWRDRYGSPDVVYVRDPPKPTPAAGEVLVRVKAASVNRADLDGLYPRWGFIKLFLGLRAPREKFPGCVVVISHDRWFLDRIATHILAFEGDSQVRFFQGNVTDYEEFRRKELGTAADQPHRIRYKRLAAA